MQQYECTYIYIYIYIYVYREGEVHRERDAKFSTIKCLLHPVSITRFPLRRFSPGAGLLRNPFVHRWWLKIFQGLGPKRRESSNGDRVYMLGIMMCLYQNVGYNTIKYRDDLTLYSNSLTLTLYYVLELDCDMYLIVMSCVYMITIIIFSISIDIITYHNNHCYDM